MTVADTNATTLFGDEVPTLLRQADVSPCGRYRYSLSRTWGHAPPVLFVMLNPSTADADKDDPTIRRCMGFAKRWGYGGITVCNLYPWRATKPADLPNGVAAFGALPEGHEHNARAIREALVDAGRVVAAWGRSPGPWKHQPTIIMDLLVGVANREVVALKLNADGSPAHPVRLPYMLEPVPFAIASAER